MKNLVNKDTYRHKDTVVWNILGGQEILFGENAPPLAPYAAATAWKGTFWGFKNRKSTKGTLTPLICIYGGGGGEVHIVAYNSL